MTTAAAVREDLAELADAADAVNLQRYFKTGPGEYGEGDIFVGVRVPKIRSVVKRHRGLSLEEISTLLESPIHEHRLAGLLALNADFAGASTARNRDDDRRRQDAEFYLRAVRAGHVDNWDLVDSSAEFVLGEYLVDRPRDILFELARSEDLWHRRVAVLSTFAFIKHGDPSTTLELAALLLDDREDLMHKAVGWMLREVGKRVDRADLLGFLDRNAAAMPRTMLGYATEHLDTSTRAAYRAARRPE